MSQGEKNDQQASRNQDDEPVVTDGVVAVSHVSYRKSMTNLALDDDDLPEELPDEGISKRQQYWNNRLDPKQNPSFLGRTGAKIEYFFAVSLGRWCRRRSRGYKWFWRVWCGTRSCFVFAYDGRIRERCKWLVKHRYFEGFILVCIAVSSVFMIFNSPLGNPGEFPYNFFTVMDIVF